MIADTTALLDARGLQTTNIQKHLAALGLLAILSEQRPDLDLRMDWMSREWTSAYPTLTVRARGEHSVDGMAEIVLELARRGKTDEWIGDELGMAPDEVLRLRQTTGLAEMFADEEFSEAWMA